MAINDLAFNQDYTCLSMSTSECHKIFNCDPFGEFYNSPSDKNPSPTAFLRMLFSTSLTIIVPESNSNLGNRVLQVYNLKQNLKICELTFPSNIVDLMLNRKRLVVFLEVGQIYIYDLSSVRLMKVLEINSYSSKKHEENDKVVAALSADDRSYLALPLSVVNDQTDLFNAESSSQPSTPVLRPSDSAAVVSLDSLVELTHKNEHSSLAKKEAITLEDLQKDSNGWMVIYDTINLKPRLLYKAHDSGIAKIALSRDSHAVATASTKGTIIRVCHLNFDLLDDLNKLTITHITNLRRGHNLTRITNLTFSLDSTVLGCGSESNTIHFFKTGGPTGTPAGPPGDYESSDEDARSGRSSSEDLNENLANLLISKQPEQEQEEEEPQSYFSLGLKKSSKFLKNQYTKSLIKKLPYRDYFDNLIWEPPRRSFAYVKLAESSPPDPRHKNVEIGFGSSGLLMLASYHTGTFYQYKLPRPHDEDREECMLLSSHKLG
ncbi:hypothetical protein FT663_02355 [Candidozyma haemuli var. vulneris]|uniref:Autophagy-related protein 21 n=1 Tax=Candidozyma haemuli TaxID=45357 RepID=A0A2V1AM05_9ASCO|nr:hypothetical protein CXQ85_000990 [[Candida] haemuloni]KAF3992298.1 hypothetical protein FT663_02355 [[Candida] haemuloni var. vulneris]KAF3994249.1 hypothetical protein FT662_00118 [[Candida] haemuloni var. vulneris]PVH18704.1 hypothetical protein CXQ85_000990 [[Candida] haemuloni]